MPGQRPLVAPSAIVQARQRLGSEAVRQVFDLTQKSWHEAASHPTWAGLRLLGGGGGATVSSGERPIHLKTVRVTAPPATSMAIPVFLRCAWFAKWS
ncbi:transposase domain-containing protein [Pseudomonas zeae]|uniref:transposase domain-containing protein n=1 Tax=Pseudomonas zeae TaxID=2745510 RepID=UPI0039DFD219